MGISRIAAVLVVSLGLLAGAAAAQNGRIEGRLSRPDGTPLAGVRVTAVEATASASTLSDAAGRYGLAVPAGTYQLDLTAGGQEEKVEGVEVSAALAVRVDRALDWVLAPSQRATETVATGKRERAAESQASVSVVSKADIALYPAGALPPTLVARVPGVQSAQSDLYDLSLNMGGLNGFLDRRVAVRIDGRDPSLPFWGGQEWAVFPLPPSSLEQIEVERSPGSVLYGKNSTGGVLNLVTRGAGDQAEIRGSASGGDQSTAGGDLAIGDRFGAWGIQLLGGYRKSDGFTLSRDGQTEYSHPCTGFGQSDCLPQEIALPRSDQQVWSTSARIDRGFDDGSTFRLGGGYTEEKGPVQTTDIGRLQVLDAERKWASLSYATNHFDLHGSYDGRAAGQQTDLTTGENLAQKGRVYTADAATDWGYFGDQLHLRAGLWYQDEQADSIDHNGGPLRPTILLPANRETLLFQSVRAGSDAQYAQLEWDATPRLRILAGARHDASDLYDDEFSPRLGLAFSLAPSQTFRLGVSRSFQAPTLEDLYLEHEIGAPLQLGSLENICTLEGVPCGFDLHFRPGAGPGAVPSSDTRVYEVGNRALKPEHVTTVEGGYSGTWEHLFLTLDLHWARHEDVISDFLPELGTSLGRINPAFSAYVPSKFLSPAAQAQLTAGLQSLLGPLFPYLTTNVDGTPIVVLASKTNAGDVDTYGADLGLHLHLGGGWTAGLTYSFLDTSVQSGPSDLPDLLLANAPRNRGNASLGYTVGRFDALVDYRYSDSYRWASGPFRGDVPSYGVADLGARFHLDRHFTLGLDVADLFDKKHWETFGGDLLRRQVLGSLTVDW